ncbi:MAG: type II toxin-antitoxin system HicA family toxin [Nanoarchaeota archaeon]|nr:type II toxin-antitoxin system HicA family toxin [Nanoarchaeota archaeon]
MKLPRISGIDVIKRLKKVFVLLLRILGSHVRLEKQEQDTIRKLTVPMHKELKSGTLSRIIKDAGLTYEEFAKLK